MPLDRVPEQPFDALVDHTEGQRGRSCVCRTEEARMRLRTAGFTVHIPPDIPRRRLEGGGRAPMGSRAGLQIFVSRSYALRVLVALVFSELNRL